MQKFITLNGLNRNLKDFYANIVKPEIKKNAGTGSNNVALIENNKIIGGTKIPYSYKLWFDKMAVENSSWVRVAEYIYTENYVQGEGGVIILPKFNADGSLFTLDYCMVAPQSVIESTVNDSGMFEKEEYVDFQAHTEPVNGSFENRSYPPGNFLIKASIKVPTAEEIQTLITYFPEITAIYDHGKYLNLNFEEITPTEEDKVFLCMSGYYYCSLGEVRTRKENITNDDSLGFNRTDGTEEDYYLSGGENGFIFNSGNIKIMPLEEGATADQIAERIAEIKNGLRFYTKDFDSVEELNNETIKDGADNHNNSTFAFANGKIYAFLKSDKTWQEVEYFMVNSEGEICNFVYPMADEFVLPAIEEVPIVDNPTLLSGTFKQSSSEIFNLYDKFGKNFIATIEIYSYLNGNRTEEHIFCLEACSDARLKEAIATVSRRYFSYFNYEKFNQAPNISWKTLADGDSIQFETNKTENGSTERIYVKRVL